MLKNSDNLPVKQAGASLTPVIDNLKRTWATCGPQDLPKLITAANAAQSTARMLGAVAAEVEISCLARDVERQWFKEFPAQTQDDFVPGGGMKKTLEHNDMPQGYKPRMTRGIKQSIRKLHSSIDDVEHEQRKETAWLTMRPYTRDLKRRKSEDPAREERAVAAGKIESFTSAVADLRRHVAAASLDAIFTDPPYPKQYLPVWRELAEFAVHALRPGGALVALSGQAWLPEVCDALRVEGLRYRWTAAVDLPGGALTVHDRRLGCAWKPVLLFDRDGAERISPWLGSDVIRTETRRGRADAHHRWGQSASTADLLAERFLQPGWRVADPMCGGGEFVLAASLRGCDVIAADSDAGVAGLRLGG